MTQGAFLEDGMSCIWRLKSVGESTEPCGAPFVKCCCGRLSVVFYGCLFAGEEIGKPFFEAGVHVSIKEFLK